MDVGFVVVSTQQAAVGFFAAAARAAKLLCRDASEGVEVVLMGRLYHREQNLNWLRLQIEPELWARCVANDASLVRVMYHLRGKGAP